MKQFVFLFLVFSLVSCQAQKETYKSISMNEFMLIYKNKKNIQILDVRTPEEHQQGVIKGAILNNVFEANFIAQANKDLAKDKPVYVYCRSGRRSVTATKMLQKEGFANVINIEGGYHAWIKQQEK